MAQLFYQGGDIVFISGEHTQTSTHVDAVYKDQKVVAFSDPTRESVFVGAGRYRVPTITKSLPVDITHYVVGDRVDVGAVATLSGAIHFMVHEFVHPDRRPRFDPLHLPDLPPIEPELGPPVGAWASDEGDVGMIVFSNGIFVYKSAGYGDGDAFRYRIYATEPGELAYVAVESRKVVRGGSIVRLWRPQIMTNTGYRLAVHGADLFNSLDFGVVGLGPIVNWQMAKSSLSFVAGVEFRETGRFEEPDIYLRLSGRSGIEENDLAFVVPDESFCLGKGRPIAISIFTKPEEYKRYQASGQLESRVNVLTSEWFFSFSVCFHARTPDEVTGSPQRTVRIVEMFRTPNLRPDDVPLSMAVLSSMSSDDRDLICGDDIAFEARGKFGDSLHAFIGVMTNTALDTVEKLPHPKNPLTPELIELLDATNMPRWEMLSLRHRGAEIGTVMARNAASVWSQAHGRILLGKTPLEGPLVFDFEDEMSGDAALTVVNFFKTGKVAPPTPQARMRDDIRRITEVIAFSDKYVFDALQLACGAYLASMKPVVLVTAMRDPQSKKASVDDAQAIFSDLVMAYEFLRVSRKNIRYAIVMMIQTLRAIYHLDIVPDGASLHDAGLLGPIKHLYEDLLSVMDHKGYIQRVERYVGHGKSVFMEGGYLSIEAPAYLP